MQPASTYADESSVCSEASVMVHEWQCLICIACSSGSSGWDHRNRTRLGVKGVAERKGGGSGVEEDGVQ